MAQGLLDQLVPLDPLITLMLHLSPLMVSLNGGAGRRAGCGQGGGAGGNVGLSAVDGT